MPLGSVNDFLVTLLIVVPGGLGVALRRSIFATQAPTAFAELLHSLAAALTALLFTEAAFMVLDRSKAGLGDYLLVPLARSTAFPAGLRWAPYLAYGAAAMLLPPIGAFLRRTALGRWIFRDVSPHADGLDYIVHEARPRGSRRSELWATVNTQADEALLGQIAWRSTAPDPLEIVLSRVRDLNDPIEVEQQEDWVVWLPGEAVRAIWVHVPDGVEDRQEARGTG